MEVGQNFIGSTLGTDSSALPPDADGAVGPNHFVEFINGRFAVHAKSNGNLVQSMTDLIFWSHAGVQVPSSWDVSDPRIVYDPSVQRWFASDIDFDPSGAINTNNFLLAVSSSADPTGTWKGVSIPTDPGGNNFADFPTMGLDSQGVYLSGDMFNAAGSAVGPTLLSIPKADLLTASPSAANRTWFNILSYTTRGSVLQPAACTDGTESGDILAVGDLGLDFLAHSNLICSTVLNPTHAGGATLSAPVTLTVTPYLVPIDPPQPDLSSNLDNGDARFSAMVRGVGGVLFAVHNIEVNNRAAIRWYRLNAANFTVLESGTISDPTLDLFYPSIAANTNGAVVIGCNGSSLSTYVSAYAIVGETVGGVTTFGSPTLLKSGTASYQNADPTTMTSRWGDYSTTSVDPADPTRFWTIQMYASGPSTWSTQISELITAPLQLAVSSSGTNVLVSWPTAAAGFTLQSTTNVSAGSVWASVQEAAATNGNSISVLVPASGGQQFFRLQSP
jgi:hypothetical protein